MNAKETTPTLATRCTIAYVSLALICLSPITEATLLLPGLICGHVALSQCQRDPDLQGRRYARVGKFPRVAQPLQIVAEVETVHRPGQLI
jgi:hypothetical protein